MPGTPIPAQNNEITNAKLSDVPTGTYKGRTTAGTGDPEDLTAVQATAGLNVFSSTLKGLVAASGGGTANFARADGTWAAPPGSGSGDNIQIGGVAVTDANFNNTTPVAAAGRTNLEFQRSGTGPDSVSVQTPATVPVNLARNTTTVTISNSIARTSIGSCSIPANALGTNRLVHGIFIGDMSNSTGSAQSFTLEIELGGTVIYNSGSSVTVGTSGTTRGIALTLDLAAKGATNAQDLGGTMLVGGTAAATTGRGGLGLSTLMAPFSADGAIDTTLTRTLEAFITLGLAGTLYSLTIRNSQFTLH